MFLAHTQFSPELGPPHLYYQIARPPPETNGINILGSTCVFCVCVCVFVCVVLLETYVFAAIKRVS